MLVWVHLAATADLDPARDGPETVLARYRLTASAFALLAVAATFWAGVTLGGRRLGIAAAVVLASFAYLFHKQGRTAAYDIHLTGWCTLAVAAGLWAMRPGGLAPGPWRRATGWAIAFLALTGGLWTKGPIALPFVLIPLAGAVALATHRRARLLGEFVGVALFTAVFFAVTWFPFLRYAQPEVVQAMFSEEYAAKRAPEDAKPPWYYLQLLYWVAPWTLFGLAGLLLPWRALTGPARRMSLVPWVWFVGVLVVFASHPTKAERYLVPTAARRRLARRASPRRARRQGQPRGVRAPGGHLRAAAEAHRRRGQAPRPPHAFQLERGGEGDLVEGKPAPLRLELVLQWTEAPSERLETFANGIPTSNGGAHESGLKSSLHKAIRGFIEARGVKVKGVKIAAEDIREGLVAILSVYVAEPQFQGQTKQRLNNPEVAGQVEGLVRTALEQWLLDNTSTADAIVARIVIAARAREASRAASKAVSRKTAVSHRLNLPGKLSDCQSTNPDESELFLVEGDSAGGNAKQARDRRTQAILRSAARC